ncbi:ACT domain-containing protein [Cephalotus follicularis]|uniref:ACT domain-containing protein ACR n=1 Tax=Cephalotus follicularis TaxID=3775 RepID=A0A1Q3CPR0_CEPFO|nr:ACT domain-containing protein [Cephalotus follicularis]
METFTNMIPFSSSSSLTPHRSAFPYSHFAPHDSLSNFFFPLRLKFPEFGSAASFSTNQNILYASSNGMNATSSTPRKSDLHGDYVPMPIVLIDQESDSEATIVQLSFGDRLGALIDTMKALKDLGLDVIKGTVNTEGSVKQTKFFITRLDTGRKVEDPELLERIRLTIINNLLKYHPESSQQLAMGEAFGIKAPEKKLDVDIATHVHVKEDGPKRSLLYIETADRPGLLVEIIKIIADINIDVESAEIETEGLVAKDKFHVSYRGAALNNSLSQVLVNCMRYYLRRPETDIDSY